MDASEDMTIKTAGSKRKIDAIGSGREASPYASDAWHANHLGESKTGQVRRAEDTEVHRCHRRFENVMSQRGEPKPAWQVRAVLPVHSLAPSRQLRDRANERREVCWRQLPVGSANLEARGALVRLAIWGRAQG